MSQVDILQRLTRLRPVVDVIALLYSLLIMAAGLPSVSVPSLLQILYFLVVPGYALLRMFDRRAGFLDQASLAVLVSLGLVVGVTALFQTFYPNRSLNQFLVIPFISAVALIPQIRESIVKKK